MEQKQCTDCRIFKDLDKFYFRKTGIQAGQPLCYCIECELKRSHKWKKEHADRMRETGRAWRHKNGINKPMAESKDSPAYLGVYISERILSKYFNHVERMPNNNSGFDFYCGKKFKIDAKSGCLRYTGKLYLWSFGIYKNQTADYFICLGFDNRKNLNPLHVWLIPGDVINQKQSLSICNTEKNLLKWSKYEKPLDKALSCCSELRGI